MIEVGSGGDRNVPDLLTVIVAFAGIFLVGLAFATIEVVAKDTAKLLIWLFLGFLIFVLVSRSLSPPETVTVANPNANPSFNPTLPDSYSVSFDNFSRRLSRWVNSGLERLDAFVYGSQDSNVSPDQVEQPPDTQPDQSVSEQPAQPSSSSEVPSRVSRITSPNSSEQASNPADSSQAGDDSGLVFSDNYNSSRNASTSGTSNGQRRPVPALW
jgi:hypothetical protein